MTHSSADQEPALSRMHYHLSVDASRSMAYCWQQVRAIVWHHLDTVYRIDHRKSDRQLSISYCFFHDDLVPAPGLFTPDAMHAAFFEGIVAGGTTALYDALGNSIALVGKMLASGTLDDGVQVKLAMLTDGHENSSVKHTAGDLVNSIGLLKASGNWEIMMIGEGIGDLPLQQVLRIRNFRHRWFEPTEMEAAFSRMESHLKACFIQAVLNNM